LQAIGYVAKSKAAPELVSVIHAALAGKSSLSSFVVAATPKPTYLASSS
jgi:DNA-binding NarL/FixJ family response regulator